MKPLKLDLASWVRIFAGYHCLKQVRSSLSQNSSEAQLSTASQTIAKHSQVCSTRSLMRFGLAVASSFIINLRFPKSGHEAAKLFGLAMLLDIASTDDSNSVTSIVIHRFTNRNDEPRDAAPPASTNTSPVDYLILLILFAMEAHRK